MQLAHSRPNVRILTRSIAALLVAGSATNALAQSFWDGDTSSDWNDAANWSAGVPTGVNALVNIPGGGNPPFTATISATIPTPVDILVGDGAGTNGQVNQTGGTATTGAGNWTRIGRNGGTGIYNLSGGMLDTNTGRIYIGEGGSTGTLSVTGSGSLSTFRIYTGAGAGGNGTLGINTSGTLTLTNDLFVGENGATGVATMTAGTLNRTGGWAVIGGSGAGGTGTFNMSGGAVTTTSGENIVGLSPNGNGFFNLTGGTYTTSGPSSVFQIGRGGGTGTATVNGATAALTVSSEIHVGNELNSNGSLTVSAGTVSSGSWIGVGRDRSTGVLTINGGTVQQTGNGSLELTNFNVGGSGTVNLNGGDLIVNKVEKQGGAGGTAVFNFNGGRLAPRANDPDFMEGLNTASVQAGGAIIDSQAFNITISQSLVAGSASGGLTKLGTGALTLDGTNTYSGATTVTGGSLIVTGAAATLGAGNASVLNTAISLSITTGVANAIADTAVLSLAGGGAAGTADLGFANLDALVDETVFGLVLGGIPRAAGTWGSSLSPATFTNDEFFSGTGVVRVTTLIPEPGAAVSLLGGVGLLLALRRRHH